MNNISKTHRNSEAASSFSLASAQSLWRTVQGELGSLLSREDYLKWFDPISCEGANGDNLQLVTESDFAELWVNRNYQELLNTRLTLAAGRQVTYSLRASTPATPPPAPVSAAPIVPHPTPAPTLPPLPAAIKSSNTFDTFIVAPENELAHAASISVSNDPGNVYNPLFIYGATGLGKTHLLHAIAQAVLRRTPKAHILYVTSETFTNDYINAVATRELTAFRSRYREADVLLVDDIQFLAEKERTQEEFFHTFNDLHTQRKQIVLTSDRPAREIASLEDRLVSRFGWGFTADIGAPRLETRMLILRQKFAAVGLEIPNEIVDFLASRIARNVRNLEGAVMKLHGYKKLKDAQQAKAGGPPVTLTLSMVTEALHDMLAEEVSDRITAELIQKKVADYYRIPVVDMTSKKRTASVAFARQVAMHLCCQLTSMSLSSIGDAFGGRDHGTVIHARQTVTDRSSTMPSVKTDVDYLYEKISNPRG